MYRVRERERERTFTGNEFSRVHARLLELPPPLFSTYSGGSYSRSSQPLRKTLIKGAAVHPVTGTTKDGNAKPTRSKYCGSEVRSGCLLLPNSFPLWMLMLYTDIESFLNGVISKQVIIIRTFCIISAFHLSLMSQKAH